MNTDVRHFRNRWLRVVAAVVSGLFVSASFAPLEFGWIAWFAFVPLLLVPMPMSRWERLLVGWIFGFVYYSTNLHWLNELFYGIGWAGSIYGAFFPAIWYWLLGEFAWRLRNRVPEKNIHWPDLGFLTIDSTAHGLLLAAFASCSWTALEYLKAHHCIFSGFPWNPLGISQINYSDISSLAVYGGAYLIGFLLMFVNGCLATEISNIYWTKRAGVPNAFCLANMWHRLAFVIVVLLCVMLICQERAQRQKLAVQEESAPHLSVIMVQGNIPRLFDWRPETFLSALEKYSTLTKKGLEDKTVDLVVWPECAVHAHIVDNKWFINAMTPILRHYGTQLLLGAMDYRTQQDSYNSVFLLDANSIQGGAAAMRRECYDKINLVPFGEFMPFGEHLAWLKNMLRLGDDLAKGQRHKVFSLPNGARISVNVCFDDVFANTNRRFVLNGANLLATVTNDSWYNESSEARQHLNHARLRAIENRRYFLRSGNNSDTCLISPGGSCLSMPMDSATGSKFCEAVVRCNVPIFNNPPLTFYTRYGDLFAQVCSFLAFAGIVWILSESLKMALRNQAMMGRK